MFMKQCSNRRCATLYNENDREFKEELCVCGNLLLDIEIVTSNCTDFKIEDVIGGISEPEESSKEEVIVTESESNTDVIPSENKNEILVKKPVVRMTQEEFEKSNQVKYSVDTKGFIHFEQAEIKEEEIDEDKLVIYLGGQIYQEVPIEYDETIVGRYSVNSEPDVDLSDIDSEGYTSRRHLMIYKEQDKYFARNLSTKNSVHINAKALAPSENRELNDNDIIILSKYIVMEFKLKK